MEKVLDHLELRTIRRMEDKGTYAWQVFNRIQENLILGGYSKMGTHDGEPIVRKAKELKDPKKLIRVNKGLSQIMTEYGIMSEEKFREEIFSKRGRMSGVLPAIYTIYTKGSAMLKEQATREKRIGIKRLAEICENYDFREQDKLAVWIQEHKQAKKKDIENYLLGL